MSRYPITEGTDGDSLGAALVLALVLALGAVVLALAVAAWLG